MGKSIMKAIILLLMSPIAIFFLFAGLQTIEFHVMEGSQTPVQTYIIIALSALWIYAVNKTGKYNLLRGMVRIKYFLFSVIQFSC